MKQQRGGNDASDANGLLTEVATNQEKHVAFVASIYSTLPADLKAEITSACGGVDISDFAALSDWNDSASEETKVTVINLLGQANVTD